MIDLRSDRNISSNLRVALEGLLRHCDVDSDGETEFERAVIFARKALQDETSRELSTSEAASFDKALARSPRRVETSPERGALKLIRYAGNNSHPTAVWMQKIAAHALEPEKWPHPGNEPPPPVETPAFRLLPIEREELIRWHTMCAQVSAQTDDFGGARRHRERLAELEPSPP